MARRALRKIDPRLDVDRYFVPFEALPRPWEGEVLFGRTAPLEVEVGSGKGMFLASASEADPDANYLGIEMAYKYARFTAARLAKAKAAAARIVHGDAVPLLAEVLPDRSVRGVHIYFPDPWWKARHKKRRLIRPTFVASIERVLEWGGQFHFWTDVEEYFRSATDVVNAHSRLALHPPLQIEEAPSPSAGRTHRERRVRLEGGTVYRARWVKG
jgi:tRNA (guanine-N7-)-methyltransferase